MGTTCCASTICSPARKDNIAHLLSEPRFEFLRHDVTFPLFVEVDEIYNLACPASPIHYQHDPVQTTKTSVHGAINMLGLAKRLGCRILQASTSEVYGDPDVHPQTEDYWGNVNPIGPRSCYDEGKRCAETLFFDYHRQHGLPIKVARIFNTYGAAHASRATAGSFPTSSCRRCSGEPITIYGDGEQTRSFCYVDDLIDGLVRLMDSPEDVTGPINLGNPTEFTIRELAETIIDMTGSQSLIVEKPLPADDPAPAPARYRESAALCLDGSRRWRFATGSRRPSLTSVKAADAMCGIAGILAEARPRPRDRRADPRTHRPSRARRPRHLDRSEAGGSASAIGGCRSSTCRPPGTSRCFRRRPLRHHLQRRDLQPRRDLRRALEAQGAVPRGRLARPFRHRGVARGDCRLGPGRRRCERSVGMFAFGLWDRKQRTLSLVRDRFGEKPLYYGWAGSDFLFGSELKALRAHPRFDSADRPPGAAAVRRADLYPGAAVDLSKASSSCRRAAS